MTAEPEPREWIPKSPEVLRIALAAFLARVRGNERHAAWLIADAGHRGISYEVLDATWWILEQIGGFRHNQRQQAELESDILRLAGWEDDE